jgi:hypothetical protein
VIQCMSIFNSLRILTQQRPHKKHRGTTNTSCARCRERVAAAMDSQQELRPPGSPEGAQYTPAGHHIGWGGTCMSSSLPAVSQSPTNVMDAGPSGDTDGAVTYDTITFDDGSSYTGAWGAGQSWESSPLRNPTRQPACRHLESWRARWARHLHLGGWHPV